MLLVAFVIVSFVYVESVQIAHSREYQVRLNFTKFCYPRATGISAWKNYLKAIETGFPALQFTINTATGSEEYVHEWRYDTTDSDFDLANILLKVQKTEIPTPVSWEAKLKYGGVDPIVARTAQVAPSDAHTDGKRKLEFEYHKLNTGASYQSYADVPSNWVPTTVADVEYYFNQINNLPGVGMSDPVILAATDKNDQYLYTIKTIAITVNGASFDSDLEIIYDTSADAYTEAHCPTRAEWSFKYEAPTSGTQMSYDVTKAKLMMDIMNQAASDPSWFASVPNDAGDFIF